MAFEGLGSFAEGLVGGLDAERKQAATEALIAYRKMTAERQARQEQLTAIQKLQEMLDKDPETVSRTIESGALNEIGVPPTTQTSLLQSAKERAATMVHGGRLKQDLLMGGQNIQALLRDPRTAQAIHLLGRTGDKTLIDLINAAKQRSTGEYLANVYPTLQGNPDEQRLALYRAAREAEYPDIALQLIKERDLATGPASRTEAIAGQHEDIKKAVGYAKAAGAGPDVIVGMLLRAGATPEWIDKFFPDEAAAQAGRKAYMQRGGEVAGGLDILSRPIGTGPALPGRPQLQGQGQPQLQIPYYLQRPGDEGEQPPQPQQGVLPGRNYGYLKGAAESTEAFNKAKGAAEAPLAVPEIEIERKAKLEQTQANTLLIKAKTALVNLERQIKPERRQVQEALQMVQALRAAIDAGMYGTITEKDKAQRKAAETVFSHLRNIVLDRAIAAFENMGPGAQEAPEEETPLQPQPAPSRVPAPRPQSRPAPGRGIELPDPVENKGRIIKGTTSGKRYKSNGVQWIEIP